MLLGNMPWDPRRAALSPGVPVFTKLVPRLGPTRSMLLSNEERSGGATIT